MVAGPAYAITWVIINLYGVLMMLMGNLHVGGHSGRGLSVLVHRPQWVIMVTE